ncbi:potassium channel family protein [Saccharomonospora sp. NPDC046836]|uniref:potassium channel family protein n=1 Tax=Saccharomonospora sp. NPDC046836 TaxID=3156921 RepID=UPI0033F6CFAF
MSTSPSGPGQLTRAQRRRVVLLAVIRPLVTVAVLVVVYYVIPVGQRLDGTAVTVLVLGLLVVVAVVAWEIRLILRSPFPTLQGIQALALVVAMFLLVYASAYSIVAAAQPGSFNTGLTRTDALYFVVTVFSTVGFGDIVPVTQTARVVVMTQMIGNLLILGVVLRVILTAVQRGQQRPPEERRGRH